MSVDLIRVRAMLAHAKSEAARARVVSEAARSHVEEVLTRLTFAREATSEALARLDRYFVHCSRDTPVGYEGTLVYREGTNHLWSRWERSSDDGGIPATRCGESATRREVAMLTAEMTEAIDTSSWFHTRNKPYLLLDTDFRIRAVNRAYEQVTAQPKLVGERIFDAFPDNPADATADGVANLSWSLESVFSRGTSDWMGIQRYDVPNPHERGAFRYKVWAPVNTAIRFDGATVAVLHHVQDITDVLAFTDTRSAADVLTELRAAATDLGQEFPDLSRQTVLGVLADSERVVLETLGHPDRGHARMLARLRLEAQAGRLARGENIIA
ncbi:hypothetical protein GPX89_26975 [Nocardia sp. ET3-3]|uniref:PAS domain-containing protein n=1 Tax=Nocardia terrae TaxID=2675851 RepID=A0A7K1V2W3_9NOCA|nr:hypothetical protein [Nocardia terrae]MVU80881.1 hypothetical protein [Nocardia terrae]